MAVRHAIRLFGRNVGTSQRTVVRFSSGAPLGGEVDRSEGDVNVSSERQKFMTDHVGPRAKSLIERDANVFLHQTLSTPCLNALDSAYGARITDVDGRRLLDFHGNSVHQVGYGNRAVLDALRKQLDALPFSPRRYTNEPAVELAEKLASLAPGDLNRVLFAPGGSLAIGMALKLARLATGRHKTVSMWDSFHGAGLDTISVGGEAVFRKGIGPLLPGGEHAPPADEYRCMWDCKSRCGGCDLKCADYVAYILEKEGDVACVIAEPIRWTPYIPRREYWQRIREACDRHGTLLIFDEIPNSLGRTGRMFTCEDYPNPDILVLGKGLGGGVLPLAALIADGKLNEVCRTAALGHYTHEKNPVACAVGLATIQYIEDHKLMQNAERIGAHAMRRLKDMQSRQPLIGDVRGRGLLIGVELVEDTATRRRANAAAERVMYACMRRGLSFKLTMGNVVSLVPPLSISVEEMDEAIDILEAALNEETESRGSRVTGDTTQVK